MDALRNNMSNHPLWKPMNFAGIAASSMPLLALNTFHTIGTTNAYNFEFDSSYTLLNNLRVQYQNDLNNFLNGVDTGYTAQTYRSRAVSLAWKYEQVDIMMGGRGSENWTRMEREEILRTGSLRGTEGHHQMNVANHPTEQSNPDNIKFFRSNEEHLQEGHHGDFRNESNAPMIDRNKMIENTNNRRVFKNELVGTGLAAVIGFAIGASVGFIDSMAQNGISPETFKSAAESGGKGAIMGLVGHGISRVADSVITPALTQVMEKVGIEVTENISRSLTMGIAGLSMIMLISVVQFVKLKKQGYSTKDSLRQVGKQAAVSVGILGVVLITQAVYGNLPAAIVGLVLSLITLGISIFKSIHLKNVLKRIQVFTIEKSYPIFIE